MKQFLPCVISFCFLVVSFIVMGVDSKSMTSKLDESNQRIYELQNQIEVKSSKVDEAEIQLKKETTGLDVSRVELDDNRAKDFFEPVFSWMTGDEYDANRNRVISILGKDSSLVKTLMPKQKVSKDGNYKQIDVDEINCKFEDLKSYVTNVNGSQYSYLSFITYSVNDSYGNEASNQCVVTYTLNDNGEFSNVEGYTL